MKKVTRKQEKKNAKTSNPKPSPKLPEERRDYTNVEEGKDEEKFQGLFFMICSCLARVKRLYEECGYPASTMSKTRQKKNTHLPFTSHFTCKCNAICVFVIGGERNSIE
jgi:hypothetical protein